MRVNPLQPQVQQVREVDKLMICLVDRSGSMAGPKDKAATTFVQNTFELAKSEGFKAFGIVEFSTYSVNSSHAMYDLSKPLHWIFKPSNGGTPLYKTLSNLINAQLGIGEFKGGILLNVISDGKNTEGGEEQVMRDIKKFKNAGHTITFICTEDDKKRFTAIGVPDDNIQTYDNTGEGLEQTYEIFRGSVQNYSKKVSLGEDVTRGFYSKTIKTN
jgi:uncharacterized protein with von Willebrand factor type A (vWA) domain